MEPEPAIRPLPVPQVTDDERERAVELLQRACGEGRMNLEEFSNRAGLAWAADTREELAEITEGLAPAPPVGTSQPVDTMSAVFGENKQRGGWRLPRALAVRAVFGSVKVDLREATIGADAVNDGVVDIHARVLFGEVKVTVPEGVEVEMSGSCLFGSRTLKLAAVARKPGTPLIRVHTRVLFGELGIRSAPLGSASRLGRWVSELFD